MHFSVWLADVLPHQMETQRKRKHRSTYSKAWMSTKRMKQRTGSDSKNDNKLGAGVENNEEFGLGSYDNGLNCQVKHRNCAMEGEELCVISELVNEAGCDDNSEDGTHNYESEEPALSNVWDIIDHEEAIVIGSESSSDDEEETFLDGLRTVHGLTTLKYLLLQLIRC